MRSLLAENRKQYIASEMATAPNCVFILNKKNMFVLTNQFGENCHCFVDLGSELSAHNSKCCFLLRNESLISIREKSEWCKARAHQHPNEWVKEWIEQNVTWILMMHLKTHTNTHIHCVRPINIHKHGAGNECVCIDTPLSANTARSHKNVQFYVLHFLHFSLPPVSWHCNKPITSLPEIASYF